MKAIEDMDFYTEVKRGQYIGRVREFRELRSRPCKYRLDAIDQIVALVSEKIAELVESRQRAAGR